MSNDIPSNLNVNKMYIFLFLISMLENKLVVVVVAANVPNKNTLLLEHLQHLIVIIIPQGGKN